MPPQDLDRPDETSRDPVEIRQDAAITIQEALVIAASQSFKIGKSTLQRWAKAWAEKRTASPVKSLRVTTREGTFYHLDREDFKAWMFDQEQNMRPGDVLRDPVTSHETPKDTARPRQTSRDTERPYDTANEEIDTGPMQKLRDENMQLKIDVEVRKQLLNQAATEITRQRDHIEGLLRENGALHSRVLQLAAPINHEVADLPPTDLQIHEPKVFHYSQGDVDSAAAAAGDAV